MSEKNCKSEPSLASLVGKGDELWHACTKTYFGRLCVAFTTRNSLKHYAAFPWSFAILDRGGWHLYYGIPNQVETRAQALRRAWYRAKWMCDGTYSDHYVANVRVQPPGRLFAKVGCNDGLAGTEKGD